MTTAATTTTLITTTTKFPKTRLTPVFLRACHTTGIISFVLSGIFVQFMHIRITEGLIFFVYSFPCLAVMWEFSHLCRQPGNNHGTFCKEILHGKSFFKNCIFCGGMYFRLMQYFVSVTTIFMQTQIMKCTERCVALSEPNSPTIVATKYRKLGDSSEVHQLARDVIRWECRPYWTMQPPPLGYFLKMTAPSTIALPMYW